MHIFKLLSWEDLFAAAPRWLATRYFLRAAAMSAFEYMDNLMTHLGRSGVASNVDGLC